MASEFKYGVFGCGKLGTAIARKLIELGESLFVCNRSDKPILKDLRKSGIRVYDTISEIPSIADVNFLVVSDPAIAPLAKKIAENKADLENHFFAHCSGVEDPRLLFPLSDAGAGVCAAHPYQTFYRYRSDVFGDVPWLIEGENLEPILEFVEKTGGKSIVAKEIDSESRILYHCSAVTASNFMNAILAAAADMLEMSGTASKSIIRKICETTLANNLENAEEFPLTGPIARKDAATVEKHLKALAGSARLRKAYVYAALATIETAIIAGDKPQNFEKMKKLLKESLV